MGLIAVFRLAISFLPAPVQVVILAIVAVLVIFVVFKLIALIKNSIPFL